MLFFSIFKEKKRLHQMLNGFQQKGRLDLGLSSFQINMRSLVLSGILSRERSERKILLCTDWACSFPCSNFYAKKPEKEKASLIALSQACCCSCVWLYIGINVRRGSLFTTFRSESHTWIPHSKRMWISSYMFDECFNS